ncbi:MAG: endonuclease MutS2 [Oscillospiraceae bacterium]|jgi:DNA mismatch repair protein MutS2|nr:endonuclease MutS2 [Oscillospiraceae bacterium]
MNRHHKTLELDKILELLAEHTACAEARELALGLTPEPSLPLARALLAQTRDAHMLLARFGGPAFGGLQNVNNALRRAQAGSMLSLRELLDVAQVLRILRGIVVWREGCAGVETGLDALFGGISPNKYLEDAIGGAILSEDTVADAASPALADIRRKIRQQESNVRQRLERITRSPQVGKFLQENLVTQRNGRFVVPVKAEFRGEVPGLVHDASSSGATVFVEPMAVVEANNEIKILQGKEREEIERILTELSELAGSFYEPVAAGYECAVELNLIFAKAQLAYDMRGSVPELNGEGKILLRRARHPLLNRDTAVPVDVSLGLTFDALIITGPNTGGKTVSIKTIGLLALMAQCGLMIPAGDQSQMAVFSQVLADIGDEQSIEQSLSTFSSHMTNLIQILDLADPSSLVLIDELGAGTDPVEGAALATAMIEALRGKGAKLAATTHYAELKAYALQTPGVENGCCEFDVETLRPTYRLLVGVPGRSNAFAISARLGMPSVVVDRARALVSGESLRFEDAVDRLEQSRTAAERAKEEAETLRQEAVRALEEAERRKAEAQKRLDQAMETARTQGMRVAEQTKREAYALLAELEKYKKEKETAGDIAELARRARAAVKKGMEAVDAAADPGRAPDLEDEGIYVLPRPLRTGDMVRLAGLGVTGTVLAVPDGGDRSGRQMVEVQAGAMRTRVPLKGLRLLEGAAVPRQDGPRRGGKVTDERGEKSSRLTLSAETRLDLRGMTVDDCLLELDRFLDSAMRSGLHEFTVVHGKGTGALRAAVQKFLKGHPTVKSFRLGVYGEGENGVTIVELK